MGAARWMLQESAGLLRPELAGNSSLQEGGVKAGCTVCMLGGSQQGGHRPGCGCKLTGGTASTGHITG